MLKLEEIYKVKGQKGFYYKQLKRKDVVVLSEQRRERDDSLVGYEVIVVQQYPERMNPNKTLTIAAREACPPPESWGSKGFSYGIKQKEHAEIRFWELCQLQNLDLGVTTTKDGIVRKNKRPNPVNDISIIRAKYYKALGETQV